MAHYRIGILNGDDIGLEIVPVAVRVLQAAAKKKEVEIEWREFPIGYTSYQQTGETLPEKTLNALYELDGWILGPIGHMAYPSDPKGDIVYVGCKLRNPQNWDHNVSKSETQKLVGSMVGDGVKNGLIITTASLNSDAKEYLMKLNGLGYSMQIIEGDTLVKELYNLRKKQLVPLFNSLQG